MNTVTILGNGAVGIAAAVALSSRHSVVLAGPSGTPFRKAPLSVEGFGEAFIPLTGIDALRGPTTLVTALKAYDISGAVPYIKEFFSGGILCLSNGMGLGEEWGPLEEFVEYAVLTYGFSKTGEYSVVPSEGRVYCRRSGLAEMLFRETFIHTESRSDMEDIRWAKWLANSIINPLGALTGETNDHLRESEMGALIQPLLKELELVMPTENSIRMGRNILDDLLDHSSNPCSMLQDLRSGRMTEIDHLTGYCLKVREGECPVAEKIVRMVKARS